jgi:phenylacetic acid degradation operon negative regulatory protein
VSAPVPSPVADRDPDRPLGSGTSARSVLLTLLGEFVLPAGGAVWTSAVIEALGSVGVEERSARQALARSGSAGLLVAERHGRSARWSLTPAATRLLREGTDRIYSLGRTGATWDGRWLLVVVTVPEGDRPLRHRLRSRMAWLGLAPLAGGLWISPHAATEPAVLTALDGLGLSTAALSFVGRSGAVGDVGAAVAGAWDLGAVEARYEEFVAATEAALAATQDIDGRDAFAALLGLVHEWRAFPALDPGLPEQLLPRPWSGSAAADAFGRAHAAWHDAAWAWWRSLEPDISADVPGRC